MSSVVAGGGKGETPHLCRMGKESGVFCSDRPREEGPPCFCREGWIKILPTGSTEPECPLIIVVVEWGYMSELCPQERKVALLLRGEIMEFRFLQQA